MSHSDWLAGAKPAKQTSSTMLLVIFFLFLVMVAVYLWQQKPAWSAISTLPFQSLEEEVEDAERETLELIWERVRQNTDRQTLQAIVYTHNLYVIHQGYPKSELLYIDAGWMIPRMPDRVNIDPKTRQFLTRFIREPVASTDHRVGLDEAIFFDPSEQE